MCCAATISTSTRRGSGLAPTRDAAGGLGARRLPVGPTAAAADPRRGRRGARRDRGAGRSADRTARAAAGRARRPLLVSSRRLDHRALCAAARSACAATNAAARAAISARSAGSRTCGRRRAEPRVAATTLAAALRNAAGADVFEDAANGGYVHAPSLTQAATAAVLRNGYLSHADSARAAPFAVNLSSARMRAAIALDAGRAQRPADRGAARLPARARAARGPSWHRARHVHLRAARPFPLVSGRLTECRPGTSAEMVEARNVVTDSTWSKRPPDRTYPYGHRRAARGRHAGGDCDRGRNRRACAMRSMRCADLLLVRKRASGGAGQRRAHARRRCRR